MDQVDNEYLILREEYASRSTRSLNIGSCTAARDCEIYWVTIPNPTATQEPPFQVVVGITESVVHIVIHVHAGPAATHSDITLSHLQSKDWIRLTMAPKRLIGENMESSKSASVSEPQSFTTGFTGITPWYSGTMRALGSQGVSKRMGSNPVHGLSVGWASSHRRSA
ncbi:hypothetical protein E2C01_005449 [Portunus trituberculatus]|uniref:Uncharacterized protein n=1 Tax=Portunus trituberculatus TaxID=210409 RepID=A0A5B7CTI5_PORTR|nr:hypothetical protein [Portunus trituberculatus]